MIEENIGMFSPEELPVTDEKKKKESVNCLLEIFTELLNDRKLQLADVQKGTGIPWGTIHGWACGDVTSQLADKNLLRLAQFFNVSLEYLCFGIGEDTPPFKNETKEKTWEREEH